MTELETETLTESVNVPLERRKIIEILVSAENIIKVEKNLFEKSRKWFLK